MKVAVIYNSTRSLPLFQSGRQNTERNDDVTISSIVDTLELAGYEVFACEADGGLIDSLKSFFDPQTQSAPQGIAFNLAFGIQGQSRQSHVPAILEMHGIPYLGSDPLVQAILLDKKLTKQLLSINSLPVPPDAPLSQSGDDSEILSNPMILKPRSESLSLDVAFAATHSQLSAARARLSQTYGNSIVEERYIAGREFNVSLLGNEDVAALPPVEIVFSEPEPHIFSYSHKLGNSARQHPQGVCPADIPPELALELQEIAKRAFRALGCRDFARVDFRVDSLGQIYILEVNGLPSLRSTSSFIRAAKASGMSLQDLLGHLVKYVAARGKGSEY